MCAEAVESSRGSTCVEGGAPSGAPRTRPRIPSELREFQVHLSKRGQVGVPLLVEFRACPAIRALR